MNLSEGGARLRLAANSDAAAATVSVGEDLDVRFALPGTSDVLQCTGTVVWASPTRDLGVRFRHLPEPERLALNAGSQTCVERSLAKLCERLRAVCA